MAKTYIPTKLTRTPVAGSAVIGVRYGYTPRIEAGGEVLDGTPHFGTFPDTPEGRAAEYVIADDGTTRSGAEILSDFGIS